MLCYTGVSDSVILGTKLMHIWNN